MNDNRPFQTVGDFLDLFGVNRDKAGAEYFCELVERAAMLRHWPELGGNPWEVAAFAMAARHISPLVYWVNMRRALAPVMETDRDALAALLGGPVGEGDSFTVYDLADALAAAIAPDVGEGQRPAAVLLASALRQRRVERRARAERRRKSDRTDGQGRGGK